MQARYIYSACIVIETPDIAICCDPWFSPGAYDGSWFQYPPLTEDPVDIIGPVDVIYISHIHPDHYDPRFLRRYLSRHPGTLLVIGVTDPPHLRRKMAIDGFAPEVIRTRTFGHTHLTIVPNRAAGDLEAVDTALVVARDGQSVVNLNDNPLDTNQIDQLLAACNGRPTVAFVPYSGAGPYPQTYRFPTASDQRAAADAKRDAFLAIFDEYVSRLRPQMAVPFAGKYFLGGPLRRLNGLRGVPDAVEAAGRAPGTAMVLADGGRAYVDCGEVQAHGVRSEPYDPVEVDRHLSGLPFQGYDYERELSFLPDRQLPLLPLLTSAYQRARARSRVTGPFWFCLSVTPGRYLCFDTSCDSGILARDDVQDLVPRCEIEIDERYLFGLLTRLYHWNNAEIGSHYLATRVPDVYRPEAYAFLHYLHV
ncbi:MAG TPA: MBL fold metallo-hydrolase [Acidimicrobiales bacterium]|nr:MBL fold metallo-hydrolase [Acidimicrobiales bacterium]